MDVALENSHSVQQDDVQDRPAQVQRAKRTYGKAKAIVDDEPIDQRVDLMAKLSDDAPTRPLTTTMGSTSSGYRVGDWRQLLKDADLSEEDEEDHQKSSADVKRNGNVGTRARDGEGAHSSPGSSPAVSRPPSRQETRRQKTSQQSANTSFASGTSGAKSSSPPSPPLRARPPLFQTASAVSTKFASSDGGLPETPHSDEELDDISPVSEETGVKWSASTSSTSLGREREKTPESPKRRPLDERIFKSPHKSFEGATTISRIKERKRPKFLGDDSDDEMIVEPTTDAHAREVDMDIEGELGWMTDGSNKKSEKRSSDKGERKDKIRKPSKKEVIEAEKETARMRAERDLDVQDKAHFVPMTFQGFFQKRAAMQPVPSAPPPFSKSTKVDPKDISPIHTFSSSPAVLLDKAKISLRERKLAALQAQQVVVVEEEESSDIEIVPETPGNSITPLNPRERIGYLAEQKKQKRAAVGEDKKKRIPKLAHDGSTKDLTKGEHNRLMQQRAAAQSTALMVHKKNDFLERGGLLTKQERAEGKKGRNVLELLERAKVVADAADRPLREQDDDEEDGDYRPDDELEDRGTLEWSSPRKRKPNVLVADSSTVDDADVELEEDDDDISRPMTANVSEHSDTEVEDGKPKPVAGVKRKNVVLSDDEEEDSLQLSDGENIPPYQQATRAPSEESTRFDLFSSLTRPVDPSPKRAPLGEIKTTKSTGIFSFPSSPISPAQRDIKVDIPLPSKRTPLQRSGSSLLPAFEQSLSKQSSPVASSSPFTFSLFGDKDEGGGRPSLAPSGSSVGFKPVNFGEISTQLFLSQPSPSQRASPSKTARRSFGQNDPLADLRAKKDDDDEDDSFLLTQPGLLGRIELSTQEAKDLQRVDQIDAEAAFREDEEERRKKRLEAEEDNEPRWINEAGLFTQTKPVEDPFSLTQTLLSQTQSQPSLFFPSFGDLSAETMLSQRSPGKTPARRLKRKGELDSHPFPRLDSEPLESPEMKMNALEYLMKPKKRVDHDENNEFIQGEAEESEDELALGFTNRGGDDDDLNIDAEEEAKHLDDRKLTKEEIAEEAILEKHMEHLAEDDAANQKLHEMAIKGQLRKSKRGHGMLDDDSSEDEARARPSKYKKRKVQGTDDLDDIARNPETQPFFQVYMKDLEDDKEDNEFAHLNAPSDDVEAQGDTESEHDDEEMQSGSEDENWSSKKVVTADEIRREVFEKVDRGEDLVDVEELLDPETYVNAHFPSSDAYLPGDYDNVKMISPKKRPGAKVAKPDADMFVPHRFKPQRDDEEHTRRLATWAKQNEKGRETTARGIASAAVTGHAKGTRVKGSMVALSKNTALQARAPARSETISSLTSKLGKKKDASWE